MYFSPDLVRAQSEDDATRFVSLGVPADRVSVTGNVKYDLPAPRVDAAELRSSLGIAADRPVFVAGSTADGEDAAVLRAYLAAREAAPGLLLILAPRHPERADAVERLVRDTNLRVVRLSERRDALAAGADVLLVDGVGHLSGLYAVAQAAFVGGSLVPVGGHNVLEPASIGLPVFFGPHTGHVAEPAAELERAAGAARVADADDLGRQLRETLGDDEARRRMGDRARAVVERSRGALERSIELLREGAGRESPSRGVA